MAQAKRISRQTVEEQIYEIVRQEILDGRRPPGQRLVQDDLARDYGVSRIPIRGALKLLQATGLVSRDDNGAYTVARFNADELAEITMLRALLEPVAAGLAAERITPEQIARLRHLNEEMRQPAKRVTAEDWLERNGRFHLMLYEISGRNRLVEIIQQLWVLRPTLGHTKSPEDFRASIEDHDHIIDALEARDRAKVEDLVRSHIEIGRQRWSSIITPGGAD